MVVQQLVVTERNLSFRMVELSKAIDVKIRLIYYPPYHSKYNPIERCWAAQRKLLERRNFRLG